MTNLTGDEREQRLKQIRERRAKLLEQRPTLSWEVNPFDRMCDEACRPFMANAPTDIDFLLSLLDSQAKGVSTDMAVLSGYESGLADAATRMRDKCVKAIEAAPIDVFGRIRQQDAIKALESLTLDQTEGSND